MPRSRASHSPLLDLWAAGTLVSALLEREFDRLGLRPPHYALLNVISVAGAITPTELAQRTGLAGTTLRDAVAMLVDRGLVQREPHPGDGRSQLLRLTRSGDALRVEALPAVKAVERQLGAALDADALATLRAAAEAALDI